MAEYVSVALAQPNRVFATASAEIAQPLAQLSYRISRAQQAAAAGDHSAVAAELDLAQAHCRGGDAPASGSARRRGSLGRQAARRRLERLMVGKLCAAPAKGGAASGLIEYLVGYAISEKGATRQEIADALDGVYAESEAAPRPWRRRCMATRSRRRDATFIHTRAELRFVLDREFGDRRRRRAEPRHPIERDAFRLVVERTRERIADR